jgi:hypothetical protein
MGSETFQINQGMLQIDKDTIHKPLKDIEQLDLVLSKIPTKALYKLHISVVHEVQSRARTNVMNLETTKEVKEILEISLNQVNLRGMKKNNMWRKYNKGLRKSLKLSQTTHK